jgi:hypothetical protein
MRKTEEQETMKFLSLFRTHSSAFNNFYYTHYYSKYERKYCTEHE